MVNQVCCLCCIMHAAYIFELLHHVVGHIPFRNLRKDWIEHSLILGKEWKDTRGTVLKKQIHTFSTSRLDYCSALLSCPTTHWTFNWYKMLLLTHLLELKNMNTTVFASLLWLPVKSKIDFKVLLPTHKVLSGLVPNYLKDLFVPSCPPRPIWFQSAGLVIPKVSKSTIGGRAFCYQAPLLWNNPPISTVYIFKSILKTVLFSESYS